MKNLQTCVTLPGSTWRARSQSGGSGVARWATSHSETATSTPGSESWGIPCWCRPSKIRKETKERKDVTQSNQQAHNLVMWRTSIHKHDSFLENVSKMSQRGTVHHQASGGYLTGWHQVKGVEQEETEALNKEHVVAVFPHQEEGNGGGTHGEIAKHLRGENSLRGKRREITVMIRWFTQKANLSGGVYVVTQESRQSGDLAREVRQSPVVPLRNGVVYFGCILSEGKTFQLLKQRLTTISGARGVKLSKGVSVLPVDHKPGYCQYPSHPGAAHHPAAYKQGCDVDRLQPKDRSHVEVNWLHHILERK